VLTVTGARPADRGGAASSRASPLREPTSMLFPSAACARCRASRGRAPRRGRAAERLLMSPHGVAAACEQRLTRMEQIETNMVTSAKGSQPPATGRAGPCGAIARSTAVLRGPEHGKGPARRPGPAASGGLRSAGLRPGGSGVVGCMANAPRSGSAPRDMAGRAESRRRLLLLLSEAETAARAQRKKRFAGWPSTTPSSSRRSSRRQRALIQYGVCRWPGRRGRRGRSRAGRRCVAGRLESAEPRADRLGPLSWPSADLHGRTTGRSKA